MPHLMNRRTVLLGAGYSVFLPHRLSANGMALYDLAYGPHRLQRMDVYLPSQPQSASIVFMVHGGAWQIGDKRNSATWRNKRDYFNRRGYIFISTNYRLLPDANPLEQAADVAQAMTFVQQNAPNWGGNPNRICLMGHSAGAHLAALLTANINIATSQGARRWHATVALDSSPYDLERTMSSGNVRQIYHDAFGSDPAFWRAASPLAQLQGSINPILLVCSTLRRDNACADADRFSSVIRSNGGRAEVLRIALTHRGINARLGTPGRYSQAVQRFLSSTGL